MESQYNEMNECFDHRPGGVALFSWTVNMCCTPRIISNTRTSNVIKYLVNREIDVSKNSVPNPG